MRLIIRTVPASPDKYAMRTRVKEEKNEILKQRIETIINLSENRESERIKDA